MYDLVVIGAGPGGYEAAAQAGKMGKKVALIEKERVGGTCLNVGCIPAKTFLRSSRLFRECKEGASFGVRVSAVEFDLPAVAARKNRVVDTLTRGVEGMLKRAGVEVVTGRARLVARRTVQIGAERIEAANILIATGARPLVPPIPGIQSQFVLDSTSVFELSGVPDKMAIIGGGYVGLEFACFFSEIGTEVTVYEALPRIAGECDGDISSLLLRTLRQSGITFKLSHSVTGIDGNTLHVADSLGSAAGDSVDYILNATGRAPVVQDLGLEDAGVDFSARGIKISDRGATNVPGVWACGDVTGRHMLAHVAAREGIVAVNSMFGAKDRIRYDAIPAVIYTHPEVAMVGKTEEALKVAGIPYKKAVMPMAVAGRFLVENEEATGLVKVLAGATYGEILGVHAIGDASSEFIVTAATMIETEMCAPAAGQIIFPHPTVSEALREALLEVRLEQAT
jgi:dihydrolipoamide dehydrogenase